MVVCHLLAGDSLALTPFSENFNGATLDVARWKLETDRSLNLSQKGGRLHFSATHPRDWSHAELLLRNNQPGSNENWEVIVEVSNTSNSGEMSTGIVVFNADDPSDKIYFEFCGKSLRFGEYRLGGGFRAYFNEDGEYPDGGEAVVNPEVTSGSLCVRFDKTTKALSLWFDKTGSEDGYKWVRLVTYSTNGSEGKRPGDWEMNRASGRFGIVLRGSTDRPIGAGRMSFDHFILRARK